MERVVGVLAQTGVMPNPMLIAATAVVGLIAFPILEPDWVMIR
ncbi:MAG TPA: hypothetical protein VKE29_03335 [Candidatus Udaeobacter sp.]|nr:hypothetical protein [Candidatus Udaeobacter sp.]